MEGGNSSKQSNWYMEDAHPALDLYITVPAATPLAFSSELALPMCLFCTSIENTYSTLGIFIFLETHDIRNALIPMSKAEILSVLSYIRDPLSIPQSIFQLIYDRLEHLTLQIRWNFGPRRMRQVQGSQNTDQKEKTPK